MHLLLNCLQWISGPVLLDQFVAWGSFWPPGQVRVRLTRAPYCQSCCLLLVQAVEAGTLHAHQMCGWVLLTHCGLVMHICVGKLTIIGSDNGLSPGWRQTIFWTSAGILLIGPMGTNFSEMLIGIQTFSCKKRHLKISSGKWWPFCLSLNLLTHCGLVMTNDYIELSQHWLRSGHHKISFGRRTHKHDLTRKLKIGRLFKHAQRRVQIGRTHTLDGVYGVLWSPANGLLPDGTKPLLEQVLTYHPLGVLWHSHEGNFTGNAPGISAWYEFENYWYKITATSFCPEETAFEHAICKMLTI